MRTIAVACLLALALTGCRNDEAAPAPDDTGPATSPSAPVTAAQAYAGPRSLARLEQAKAEVKPFMAWNAAYAKLLARVGTPDLIDGGEHYWYLKLGDKCHELFVENAGGEVGAVSFGAYGKIMKRQWERCAAAEPTPAADALGAAEAPAAPPAPVGASAVTAPASEPAGAGR
jgi:hypothetical protein